MIMLGKTNRASKILCVSKEWGLLQEVSACGMSEIVRFLKRTSVVS